MLMEENEINRIFSVYLSDLAIPANAVRLQFRRGDCRKKQDLRARIHALVDQIPDDKLAALEPMLSIMAAQDKESLNDSSRHLEDM